jgi:hypothetical protein
MLLFRASVCHHRRVGLGVGELAGDGSRVARREPSPRPEDARARVAATAPVDRLLAVAVVAVPAAGVVLFGGVEPEHALVVEAAALVLGSVVVVRRARQGMRALPAPHVTVPVLLLAALAALQLAPLSGRPPSWLGPGWGRPEAAVLRSLSVFPAATHLALLRWLAYGAFLVAALDVLERPGAVRVGLGGVAALGLVEAVYGIGNLLVGGRHVLWMARDAAPLDATGTLVNRNHFAAVLELCLPALLARRWLGPRDVVDGAGLTALTIIGGVAMGLASLLSHSRAGLATLVLAMTTTAALGPPDAEGRHARRVVLVLGGIALVAGAYVGLGPLVARFAELAGPTADVRPALWSDAADVVADFPLTGAGAGTFEAIFPAYRHAATDQHDYAHAHQDYLELAAEGGAVAVAFALVAAWGFAATVTRALRRRDRSLALAATLGGLVAVTAHAAVDFPLHIPGITFLFLLIAAAARSIAQDTAGPQPHEPRLSHPVPKRRTRSPLEDTGPPCQKGTRYAGRR